MDKFIIYIPKSDNKFDDLVEKFMKLIPYGEENAIDRTVLTRACVCHGLIDEYSKDKDRTMRKLLQKAKIDYAICSTVKGYFRPTKEDVLALKRCIAKEKSRVQSTCFSINTMEKLYEDYKAGRCL